MVQPLNNPYTQMRNRTPKAGSRFAGVNTAPVRGRAFAAGAAALIAVAGFATVNATRNYLAAGAASSAVPGVTVRMRVTPGASLWSLASRYGNPRKSIVDRVEEMAALNHMTNSDTLMPGQRILVKVENPVEVANLKQNIAVISTPPHTTN